MEITVSPIITSKMEGRIRTEAYCNKFSENEREGIVVFESQWNSGVRGKLECYGVIKLRNLARAKNLKKIYSLNKFELIILDKDLQLLSRSFINQSIIAEVSFIKNNRLYVKSSNNNFIIYSLSN